MTSSIVFVNLFGTVAPAPEESASWFDTIVAGGVVGFIILGLSIVALALVIIHIVQIRRTALLPPDQIQALDAMLAAGDVNGALEYCLAPENDSYLVRIMSAGLARYQRSAFGAFEIKNAIEETGEDQTARLYRSTDALGLIGTIAPLLGLLGTVLGMVGAFQSISQGAGGQHEELAGSISLALVTTLLGLILAIPCVALFTYFRNRIDGLTSEAANEIERLVIYLESGVASGAVPNNPSGVNPQQPTQPGRPPAPVRTAR